MYKLNALNNVDIFNIIKVTDFKEYNEVRIFYINNTDEILSFSSCEEYNNFKSMLNNILNNKEFSKSTIN